MIGIVFSLLANASFKYVTWELIVSPLLPRCALTSAECCEMVPTNEVRLGLILKLVHHVWM